MSAQLLGKYYKETKIMFDFSTNPHVTFLELNFFGHEKCGVSSGTCFCFLIACSFFLAPSNRQQFVKMFGVTDPKGFSENVRPGGSHRNFVQPALDMAHVCTSGCSCSSFAEKS